MDSVRIFLNPQADAEDVTKALKALCRVSSADKKILFAVPGVMDRVLELHESKDPEVVRMCTSLVRNWSFIRVLAGQIYRVPGLIDTTFRIMCSTTEKDVLEATLGTFQNLSTDMEVSIEMRSHPPGLLDFCIQKVTDQDPLNSMCSSIIFLNVADEQSLIKFNFPLEHLGMIIQALTACLAGKSYLHIRWDLCDSLRPLRSICVVDKYRDHLFDKFKFIDLVLDAGKKAVNEIKKDENKTALEHVFSILTQYTFDDKPLAYMRSANVSKSVNQLIEFVRGQANLPDPVRRGAEGLDFQLKGPQKPQANAGVTRRFSFGLLQRQQSQPQQPQQQQQQQQQHRRVSQFAQDVSGVASMEGGDASGEGDRHDAKSPPGTNNKKNRLKVMISYQWQMKHIAVQVEKFLLHYCHVWRDENEIRGDVIEAMSEAVAESDLVVVIVSPSYKESANCKLECKLAHNSGKKIVPILAVAGYVFKADGWLGAILGSLLYYDISDSLALERELAKFVRNELGNLSPRHAADNHHSYLGGGDAAARGALSSHADSASGGGGGVHNSTQTVVVPNTPEEIVAWCAKLNMPEVAPALSANGFACARDLRNLYFSIPRPGAMELKALLGLSKGVSAVNLYLGLQELFLS